MFKNANKYKIQTDVVEANSNNLRKREYEQSINGLAISHSNTVRNIIFRQ